MREPLRLPPVHPAPAAGAPLEAPRPAAPRDEAGERFYPVAPFGRPSAEQRQAMVWLVDAIGLHLICQEPRCRRAKRCRDPDRAQLPLCFWLHRGTCRFVLAYLEARAEHGGPTPGREARPGHAGRTGHTLLGDLRRAGWPIERLARSRENGADEWSWEVQPEARALVEAFRRPKETAP